MARFAFRDLSCLVVDDEPTILQDMAEMLQSMGVARVTTAMNASTALAKLANTARPFDCILCDQNMPDGTGLQVLKAIRTGRIKSSRMDACFIIVTGFAEQDAIKTALHLDINGYLVKPVMGEKLRDAIIRGRQRHFPVDLVRYQSVPVPALIM